MDSGPSSTTCTLTVRVIRSFPHRNVRNIVIHDVQLGAAAGDFLSRVVEDLKSKQSIPPPVRNYSYDTLKIECQPFHAKTSNTVINTDDSAAPILKFEKTLEENGVVHETELSLFKMSDYLDYKRSPEFKW